MIQEKITFEQLPEMMATLLKEVRELKESHFNSKEVHTDSTIINPIDEYIPKNEVRNKLASSSTLWHWEKKGKLKSYGIGGKRFYKRSDIEELFTEIKKG